MRQNEASLSGGLPGERCAARPEGGRAGEQPGGGRLEEGQAPVQSWGPQEMYETCVDALRRFVRDAGFSEVVVGLSGGLDSSVVAVMAADALGADKVHGIMLPGPYSSDHSLRDARDVARRVGMDVQEVSICEPFEAFARALAPACGGSLSGLAAENTQARCRMVCLMAAANANEWLMLNTGNKSEAMMGYSTLYGDTAGAFAPIGGLYKTDVYAVARWRNARAEERGEAAPVPANVLAKPPSAELAPGQSDEESLGVDYPTLDAILKMAMERGLSADEIAARGYDRALVASVLRRAHSYAFKRALEPPYPSVAFYA